MPDLWRKRVLVLLLILSVPVYLYIGYVISRWEHIPLSLSYTILFGFFAGVYFLFKNELRIILWSAIIFRLAFLFSTPSLSDDVYRFIWDASFFIEGENPFQYTPEEYMSITKNVPEYRNEVYSLLSSNTQKNYTIYPPVAQYTTTAAYWMAGRDIDSTITILHFFMVLVEAFSIWLIVKLLSLFKLPVKQIILYALNPLVVLELSGNLHHEGYMIVFCLASIYLLSISKPIQSSVYMALAIASKLLPLMFLPLMIRRLGWKSALLYFVVTGTVVLFLFIPFLDLDFVKGMKSSIGLYFQKFEFNASIYYLVREAGYYYRGYNVIQTAGPRLALITFLMLLVFFRWESIRRLSLPEAFMWVLVIYLSMTSILHPWYLIPVIAFSIFTRFWFPTLWSFLIFFTYLGYSKIGFEENYTIVIVEYVLVFGFMFYELFNNKRIKLTS